MKRNKQKAKQSRSGKSPYAKYGKTETIYSPSYYAWFRETTGKAHRMDLGRRSISTAPSRMAA